MLNIVTFNGNGLLRHHTICKYALAALMQRHCSRNEVISRTTLQCEISSQLSYHNIKYTCECTSNIISDRKLGHDRLLTPIQQKLKTATAAAALAGL